jgi:F0F1-type ATP synthase gamma subunit
LDQLFKQLLAYVYLNNANQFKYSLVLIGLNMQQTLKNEQYPKIITDANSVFRNHKFDTITSGNKNKNEHWKQESKPDM